MNMDILAVKYAGLGELWAAITEILQTSTEFQAYLAASSVRSIVAPLLINITQDLARSSSGRCYIQRCICYHMFYALEVL